MGDGTDRPLTLGATLQALAEQLAGEIDVRNDLSTGEQVMSYFDWAKENAMAGAKKLAELEAQAEAAPSRLQIEQWEKDAVSALHQETRAAFLQSPEGMAALDNFVRDLQMTP